jgi:hypothetical protein
MEDGYCIVKPPDVEDVWELDIGISRKHTFPADASCRMNPRYPKDIGLSDNLYGAGVPVISRKLKEVLENNLASDRVEYLPVRIIDHKGRVASGNYFILNPLDIRDCIDTEQSKVEWNSISPDRITTCENLVLKYGRIPQGQKIFRMKHWEYNILVLSDLVDVLNAAGMTGLVFRDIKGYNGIG